MSRYYKPVLTVVSTQVIEQRCAILRLVLLLEGEITSEGGRGELG